MPLLKNKNLKIFLGFLVGAFFLCALSMLQKFIAGFDPFKLKAYIIPFVFGGISGAIVSFHILKIKKLNLQLTSHINNLEKIIPIYSHCKKLEKLIVQQKTRIRGNNLNNILATKQKVLFLMVFVLTAFTSTTTSHYKLLVRIDPPPPIR